MCTPWCSASKHLLGDEDTGARLVILEREPIGLAIGLRHCVLIGVFEIVDQRELPFGHVCTWIDQRTGTATARARDSRRLRARAAAGELGLHDRRGTAAEETGKRRLRRDFIGRTTCGRRTEAPEDQPRPTKPPKARSASQPPYLCHRPEQW